MGCHILVSPHSNAHFSTRVPRTSPPGIPKTPLCCKRISAACLLPVEAADRRKYLVICADSRSAMIIAKGNAAFNRRSSRQCCEDGPHNRSQLLGSQAEQSARCLSVSTQSPGHTAAKSSPHPQLTWSSHMSTIPKLRSNGSTARWPGEPPPV